MENHESIESEVAELEAWICKSEKNSGAETAPKEGTAEKSVSSRRKNSFVWPYFRPTANVKTLQCTICNACVSHQTSNLARHLLASHNIKKYRVIGDNAIQASGSPTRSYIWKYCTKENARHARCHLCNKLLYCGSGSTSNISKHLSRRHADIIGAVKKQKIVVKTVEDEEEEEEQRDSSKERQSERSKTRKGGSYVWTYVERLSRHTVCCKLCEKVMSFHGTANVITHLQRKHNVVGRIGGISATDLGGDADLLTNVSTQKSDESKEDGQVPRNGSTVSDVWNYCQRVGTNSARCGICNKMLAHQGTSNLQRHLHRMHGVIVRGRESKIYDQSYNDGLDDKFIWQYCQLDENGNPKCTLCPTVFPENQNSEILKHLLMTHAIKAKAQTTHYKLRRQPNQHQTASTYMDSTEDDLDGDDAENDDEVSANGSNKTTNDAKVLNNADMDIKKDYEDYDMLTSITDTDKPFVAEVPMPTQLNPLSSHSSRSPSLERHDELSHTYSKSTKLQKLMEERVRMETECYREKADFYRMQKHLTALQAKKVQAELEQIYKQNATNSEINGITPT